MISCCLAGQVSLSESGGSPTGHQVFDLLWEMGAETVLVMGWAPDDKRTEKSDAWDYC